MPGRFGQLARQRLDRDHRAGLGRFAVKPFAAMLLGSPGEVGRFDKRPSQVFVAALAIVVPLLLFIAPVLRVHRAAIAGKVPRCFEAADLSPTARPLFTCRSRTRV